MDIIDGLDFEVEEVVWCVCELKCLCCVRVEIEVVEVEWVEVECWRNFIEEECVVEDEVYLVK